MIFKTARARISIPTTRVFGKYPRVRQICPQMDKLVFLETWKMNWGSAKATNHCGTFTYIGEMGSRVQCHSKAVGAWCDQVLGRCGMVLGGSWDSVA